MSYRGRNGENRTKKQAATQNGSDVEMAPPPNERNNAPVDLDEVIGNNHADQGELDNLPPFNPKEFQHFPILAAHHAKIKTVSDAWVQGPKESLDNLAKLVRESASLLGEGDPETLEMLDTTIKQVIDARQEIEARHTASVKLREDLTRGVKIADPSAMWDKEVDQSIASYQAKTSRQKYANNQTYISYQEEVWTATNEGPMPPVKSRIKREDGDDSDEDDDMEVGGMTQNFRDPLTRGWLDKPVTSKICHHSYSLDSIKAYLVRRGMAKKCPAVGCDKNVTIDDLERDEALERQVRNAKRKEEEANYARGRGAVVDSVDEIVD